jgi:hypothetical protein
VISRHSRNSGKPAAISASSSRSHGSLAAVT